MTKAHVLLFDGYADWELGHVLAELRRFGGVEVVGVGFTDKNVISMGGLRVIPDMVLSDVNPDEVLIFIIPGGYLWEGEYPVAEVEKILHRLAEKNVPIAAICAATLVVARAGLTRDRKHTSNSLDYITGKIQDYADAAYYVDLLCVRDRHLITASGLGAVELTVEVLAELNIASPEERTAWCDAFKHGVFPRES
ncbi:MAG: DJ-1/PfpI family protein [Pseudomonadota bacterium]